MSINTNQYRSQHIQDKAKDWVQEVNKSVKVVKSEPNCAIAAFTQGPRNCYTYLIRTIPGIEDQLHSKKTYTRVIRKTTMQQRRKETTGFTSKIRQFRHHQSSRYSKNRVHKFKKVN